MDSELNHPLIAQLRPIFAELRNCSEDGISSAISKLDYIIEEEKDALFRRDTGRTPAALNSSRILTNYINQNIRNLFASESTQLAGIRVIESLLNVEYDDLNEKTKLFSELLVVCSLDCTSHSLGLYASEVWSNLLVNKSSVIENITTNCLNFSIVLLNTPHYDAAFFEDTDGSYNNSKNNNLSRSSNVGNARNNSSNGNVGASGASSPKVENNRSSAGPSSPLDKNGTSEVDTATGNSNESKSGATDGKNGSKASTKDSSKRSTFPGEHPEEELVLHPFATKISGCVFITLLIKRVPSTVSPHVGDILEGLRKCAVDYRVPCHDPCRVTVINTFQFIYRYYDATFCRQWQDTYMGDILKSLHYGSDVILDGCLKLFNGLLASIVERKEGAPTVSFSPYSANGVKIVWGYLLEHISNSSINREIQKEMLNSLPLLAKYDSAWFKDHSASKIFEVAYNIFAAAEGSDDRAIMFNTLGKLVTALPELLPLWVDRIMSYIEKSLVPRPSRGRCQEAVSCFATLSEAGPSYVRPYLRHILNSLFSGPITLAVTQDVARLCAVFPELRSNCLSKILDSMRVELGQSQKRDFEESNETSRQVLNSLNALCTLDFTGYSTLGFLNDCVIRYVSDPQEEVRRCAIDVCFKLVLSGCHGSSCCRESNGMVVHHGKEHVQLITSIIGKLVNAAVADSESDIRLHTLEKLTCEYDYTLALQSIASSIFPALHDKHQNRIAAVRLLGRISTLNPSCIYPTLRRVLVQCARDIQLFQLSKKREQATIVLSTMVEAAPDMVQPYITSLLTSCSNQLRDTEQVPSMQTALLSCIGKLALYAQGENISILAEIRPVVISHILDSSILTKKQEAIRTLGNIVRTTKDVDVYECHPELLHVLLSALHGGFKETWPVRNDVLKLMGIIGAVDPMKVKDIFRSLRDGNDRLNPDSIISTDEESVALSVIRNVLDVLNLPSVSDDQCLCAVKVMCNIFSLQDTIGNCLVPFHAEVIAIISKHAQQKVKIRPMLINVLSTMISILRRHIRPYINDLLTLLVGFMPSADRDVLVEVLCLVSELRNSLREEFKPYLPQLIPPIINITVSNPKGTAEPVFAFFVEMGVLLDEHLHNILPCVCDYASNVAFGYSCRSTAVDTLRNFAKRLPRLAFHATRCVHCLCAILKEPDLIAHASLGDLQFEGEYEPRPIDVLISISLDTLRWVGRNLGTDFEKFSLMVFPILEHYGSDGKEVFASIQSSIKVGGRVQVDHTVTSVVPSQPYHFNQSKKQKGQFDSLEKLLIIQDIQTEVDWSNWLRRLSVELLRCSRSPSHESAFPLAHIHEPFARRMLYSAFAVCYREMDQAMKEHVTNLLGNVLREHRVPSEVLQELLNLAEFMERLEIHYNPKPAIGNSRRGADDASNGSTNSSFKMNNGYNGGNGSSNRKEGLLFDLKTLMDSSERCNLYSKALHYVEIKFYELTKTFEHNLLMGKPMKLPLDEWKQFVQLCEKSIYLCNLLGQRESAEGILKYIQNHFFFLTGKSPEIMSQMMDAQMFEKLQWWSKSLGAYEHGLHSDPNSFNDMVGYMRSLDNLGDYGRLLSQWKIFHSRVSRKEATDLAPFGAHAAWLLRRWDEMENVTALMTDEGYTGTTAVFYRAVLAVHKQTREAESLISMCRKRLDATLSALVAESYDRAYQLFVGIQQLSELEEIAFIASKSKSGQKAGQQGERWCNLWRDLWKKRLIATAYEGWPGTLANHTLVLPPESEIDMWLRFVSLARKSGREQFASDILFELLGSRSITAALEEPELPQPAIALASFQHLYAIQKRDNAKELLGIYLKKTEEKAKQDLFQTDDVESLAKCHSQLSYWLFSDFQKKKRRLLPSTIREIKMHLDKATELDEENGMIWHVWAHFHTLLIDDLVGKNDKAKMSKTSLSMTEISPAGVDEDGEKKAGASEVSETQGEGSLTMLDEYVIAALNGYVRSIYLSQELEDVLGFLSLWFQYCSTPAIQNTTNLQEEMLHLSPNVWLKVIPQIIARIHSSDPILNESVFQLLSIIASTHPQALLYNLNVTNISAIGATATSEQVERRKSAQRILSRIMDVHPNGRVLVSNVGLVCQELVRCAVLWTELWFDELERMWHNWVEEQNAQAVLNGLRPLLEQLESPQTIAETHFVSEFGDLIHQACEAVECAASTGNNAMMETAWEKFRTVVKGMDDQIANMSSLALQLVSPKLSQYGKNLMVVVPGQYNENGNYPRIASFQNTLRVMNSKQHPRRLYINGTDGVTYKFLLKGHEDLRLDERVMQLLGFVNTLLVKHSITKQRDLMIQTYSATPLSDNAGLVGWVDHCSTMHQLIREFRVHSKYLSIEWNYMSVYGVNLDRLTNIQHIEPFEYTLMQTEGTDLANILWMKAPSAESWLDRRTTYVCSLATMSMVGHILGLGDRHPSNLMVHTFTGRVVHIDFGDCFDVAQQRSIVPERVPFRLTRMLVKAMEMGGIEGLFRHGSISVMSILRSEGSSILALLEAFVHDPLVMWWRDNEGMGEPQQPQSSESPAPPQKQQQTAPNKMQNAAFFALGESFKNSKRMTIENVGSLHPRTLKVNYVPSATAPRTLGDGDKKEVNDNEEDKSNTTKKEHRSTKAEKVVYRIKEKLEGRDFRRYGPTLITEDEGLPVEQQVARLIEEATSNENLCVHFQGWCPFW